MSVTRPEFRTDVQGIRALAVLLVVLYHAGAIVPAGFIGVDMFFVISGFVIMLTVQRRLESDRTFSFSEFLGRRIRRLFPALSLVIATTMLLAPWFGTISSRTQTLRTGLFSSLSAANVYLYRFRPDGYFESKEKTNALLHLWSLAIEEQFYLGFALILSVVVLVARRRNNRPRIATTFMVPGGLSFVLCVTLGYQNLGVPGPVSRVIGADSLDSDFNFYLPLTRAWEFVAGILLALAKRPTTFLGRSRARQIAVVVLLVGSISQINESTTFPSLVTLLPVGLTVLLIGQSPMGGVWKLLLESRIMQWIGDRSYSWYLWHWPFVQFADPLFPGNKGASLVAAAISLVPAHLSFTFIESRFRGRKIPTIRTVGLGILPVCVAIASFFVAASPVGELDVHLDAEKGCESGEPMLVRRDSRCTVRLESPNGRAILVGDSHAGQLSEGFVAAAGSLGLDATIATRAGKPLLAGNKSFLTKGDDPFLDAIIKEDPDVVVIAQSKDYPLDETTGTWEQRFRQVLLFFQREGIEVVVVNSSAIAGIEPRECSVFSVAVKRCESDTLVERTQVEARVSASFTMELEALQGADAELVNLVNLFCGNEFCPTRRENRWMWRDSSHMSRYASELTAPYLEAGMKKVLAEN